ncbi:MAG TPA: protein phosphatase 2C domain-containing protein [Ktedonobacterales bacterium]|nr:protein phosphatase 2C domain-containing protein [Ktedonobacterales bacterium]
MDDLHPDSADAKRVKIRTDETTNTTSTASTTDTTTVTGTTTPPADEPVEAAATEAEDKEDEKAEGKENAISANGVGTDVAEVVDAADVQEAGDQEPVAGITSGAAEDLEDLEDTEELPVAPPPDLTASEDAETVAPDKAAYASVRELGRDGWGRILLARRADSTADMATDATGEDQEQPPVGMLERATLDLDAARRIIEYHLYHGRILAPRALIEREGDLRWLAIEAVQPYDMPFTSIADGGRVDAKGALKAGVGLANALSYLHTNGFAHKHVGPDAILVHGVRAYLSGIELAASVETTEPASAELFAADVNALARALVTLADLPEKASADETGHAQVLRAIAARAAAAEFVTAEDLAQECGQALQDPVPTLPVPDMTAIRPLVFQTGTATTVGLLRSQNQDALGCSVLDIRDDIGGDRPLGIFLVADGMGGEAAGEIASRIGARIVMAELVRQLLVPCLALPALEPLSPDHISGSASVQILAQALAIAVDAANRQVRGLAASLQESTGTTLTAIVAAGGRAVLAHLGDSRAYLLRNRTLVQLTRDHSLLARLEELDHPLLNDPSFGMPRNYLYRSLGQEDEAPPDMMEFSIAAGDRLLICSDGMWDELNDETIQHGLTSSDDPAECANHLVRLANAAGGHDNSTAVVVFAVAQPDDPASEISREEVNAILRAAGVFDDGDDTGAGN